MRQFTLLYVAVFIALWGQQALNPLIAPLAREIGMAEWQAGAMMSVGAVMVVLTSGPWGRSSQRWGRKRVLVGALLLGSASTLVFAFVALLGMRGVLTGTLLVVLLVAVRGLLFGTALSAIGPTAQAYVADATDTETERVAGMAGIGAAQGMATIGGAAIGGLLGGLGLLVPMFAVPAVLLLGALLLWRLLPRQDASELVAVPLRMSVRDRRVRPYLIVGFGTLSSLAFVQILVGFLVQDRGGLGTEATATVGGLAMLSAGVAMLVAQLVIVPRTAWPVATLLRVGSLVAIVGLALMVVDGSLVLLFAGVMVSSLGIAMIMPAYNVGPTLLVEKEALGAVAGLISATNGLTYIIAPLAATTLYGIWPLAPMLVACAAMVFVAVFVHLHPQFRRAAEVAVPSALDPR